MRLKNGLAEVRMQELASTILGTHAQETLNILNLVPLRQRNIGTALQDKQSRDIKWNFGWLTEADRKACRIAVRQRLFDQRYALLTSGDI